MDDIIALRIERDRRDRRPVAGLAAPASWVELACPLVKFVPAGQQTAIPAGMALGWRHVSDTAVPMCVVVPMDEARRPFPCRIEFGEAFDREFRPVFGGAEHSFGIRIVVADAWP